MLRNTRFIYLAFFTIQVVLSFKRIPQHSGHRSFGYLPGKYDGRNILSDLSSASRLHSRENALLMSSLYGNILQGDLTKTIIESPSLNSRKITASILVNSPIQDVWSIITDYNRLALHVPNLVKSYVLPDAGSSYDSSSDSSKGLSRGQKVRIFQEGAQKIVGFDFRASLTMDMTEGSENEGRAMAEKRTLNFKLVESGMFSSFDGNWSIRYHARTRVWDIVSREFVFRYKTLLTYTVLVKPKGPVPVIALEWRIKEDVPINLMAMKTAAENVTSKGRPQAVSSETDLRTEWGADETLGMYLGSSKLKSETVAASWVPRVIT